MKKNDLQKLIGDKENKMVECSLKVPLQRSKTHRIKILRTTPDIENGVHLLALKLLYFQHGHSIEL